MNIKTTNDPAKDNENKPCTIVYEYAEEIGPGSSYSPTAFPFTSLELKDEFVKNWNKYCQDTGLEPSDDTSNYYYGDGDWRYWLEIKEGVLNYSK